VFRGAHSSAVGWGSAVQARRLWVRILMVLLEFFIDNLSGHTMALGLTQPLTEMSTRIISWVVKAAGSYSSQPYYLHVPNVMKSGSLKLLETLRVCPELLYHFTFTCVHSLVQVLVIQNEVCVPFFNPSTQILWCQLTSHQDHFLSYLFQTIIH